MTEFNSKTIKDFEKVLKLAVDENINIIDACRQCGYEDEQVLKGIVQKFEESIRKTPSLKKQIESVRALYRMYMGLVVSKKIPKDPSNSSKQSLKKTSTKKSKSYSEDDYFGMSEEEQQEQIDYDATTDEKYEDRSIGEIVRGNETFLDLSSGREKKKIISYRYKIFVRDEEPLIGEFSREEMDKIYRLYSNMDGAGLTLRSVSREFSFLTFKDFKRILRAFNITKASIPVAPHFIEENSSEVLEKLIFVNKENNLLKRIEDEKSRHYEKEYVKTKKEIFDLKLETDWVDKRVENYFKKHTPKLPAAVSRPIKTLGQTERPLFCFFGDIHYGKKFDRTIFGRGYNKEIAHDRVMQIAKRTIQEAKLLNPKEIILVSMGDLLECAMEDGMHAGHTMEMDLFQENQIFFAVDSMVEMLKTIIAGTNCKITFGSIHGNHDRIGIKRDDDKSRTAGKIVTGMIQRILANEKNFTVLMPENNLLSLQRGKICLFAHHGDSALNKKKPSEIVNAWGQGTSSYHIILKGHWHSLKADEGTNYLTLTTPSVASADKFILEELGNNNLPGFILGHEPECYGFDYKKITLY